MFSQALEQVTQRSCAVSLLEIFQDWKNKAPSNLTKCLSFQQEVGLQTSWCPLQYEVSYDIPYSDFS